MHRTIQRQEKSNTKEVAKNINRRKVKRSESQQSDTEYIGFDHHKMNNYIYTQNIELNRRHSLMH